MAGFYLPGQEITDVPQSFYPDFFLVEVISSGGIQLQSIQLLPVARLYLRHAFKII
jgi:hypothetical protein